MYQKGIRNEALKIYFVLFSYYFCCFYLFSRKKCGEFLIIKPFVFYHLLFVFVLLFLFGMCDISLVNTEPIPCPDGSEIVCGKCCLSCLHDLCFPTDFIHFVYVIMCVSVNVSSSRAVACILLLSYLFFPSLSTMCMVLLAWFMSVKLWV